MPSSASVGGVIAEGAAEGDVAVGVDVERALHRAEEVQARWEVGRDVDDVARAVVVLAEAIRAQSNCPPDTVPDPDQRAKVRIPD